MFRVIVVPRYVVLVEKREKSVSILFQALLVSQGGLALAISARQALKKAIHIDLCLRRYRAFNPNLSTVSIIGFSRGRHLTNQFLELPVKWLFIQIFVEVTDEVDKTFLLSAA